MKLELERTVDLLQEYIIRMPMSSVPISSEVKPIIKIKEMQIEEEVNKKQLIEETSGSVQENKKIQNVYNDSNINTYLFQVTRDKDKLFWAFYIMLHGEDAYKYLKTKFVVEKEIKIGAVEKMRKLPNVFKQHKLNKVRIENELSGDVPLTLEGFYGLCIIYNISAIFMKKNCYCELYGIGDTLATHVVEEVDGGLGIHVFKTKEASLEYAKQVRESKWKMETVLTPIKSISSYTHAELLAIYNKVTSMNKETTGFTESFKEKKTKQFLYDGICEFLN
jgi:hypothetical protein